RMMRRGVVEMASSLGFAPVDKAAAIEEQLNQGVVSEGGIGESTL
ncbi:MAG: hypothetical protein IVW55_14980, partial [Chloroflexi bacterium]|nr:hypothetical protein [Chloroflexota bacterium]